MIESPPKERPILYSGPMVRAIRRGIKTQTRRALKLPRDMRWYDDAGGLGGEPEGYVCEVAGNGWWHVSELSCPYGDPGDRLWVRECFGYLVGRRPEDLATIYRADAIPGAKPTTSWRPSIFLPRAECRIVLEISEVRAQRAHDISDEDIIAEGIEEYAEGLGVMPNNPGRRRELWEHLWDSVNGGRDGGRWLWHRNPWTWAITFRVVEGQGGRPR